MKLWHSTSSNKANWPLNICFLLCITPFWTTPPPPMYFITIVSATHWRYKTLHYASIHHSFSSFSVPIRRFILCHCLLSTICLILRYLLNLAHNTKKTSFLPILFLLLVHTHPLRFLNKIIFFIFSKISENFFLQNIIFLNFLNVFLFFGFQIVFFNFEKKNLCFAQWWCFVKLWKNTFVKIFKYWFCENKLFFGLL